MLGPLPSSVAAPSIWYDAVLVPNTKPAGSRTGPSPMLGILLHRVPVRIVFVTIDVRRALDRFVTRDAGRTTWHSFSFGAHYDPDNVGFGAMVAHNDEHLPAGTGY